MRVSMRVFVALAALSLCVLSLTATAAASPSRRPHRPDLLSEQSAASIEKLIKLDVFKPLPKRPEPHNSALLKQQQPNGYSPLMAYSQQPTNAPKALYEAQWVSQLAHIPAVRAGGIYVQMHCGEKDGPRDMQLQPRGAIVPSHHRLALRVHDVATRQLACAHTHWSACVCPLSRLC